MARSSGGSRGSRSHSGEADIRWNNRESKRSNVSVEREDMLDLSLSRENAGYTEAGDSDPSPRGRPNSTSIRTVS
jgi:hypothetical protein